MYHTLQRIPLPQHNRQTILGNNSIIMFSINIPQNLSPHEQKLLTLSLHLLGVQYREINHKIQEYVAVFNCNSRTTLIKFHQREILIQNLSKDPTSTALSTFLKTNLLEHNLVIYTLNVVSQKITRQIVYQGNHTC